MAFYRKHFKKGQYLPLLKTRDIDFLVPAPEKIQTRIDVPELLKDLGFVIGFKGSQGYIRLEHPELIVEFIVPEKGKGSDKPYPLAKLGLNAQPLRFLDILTQNTIQIKEGGILISLPHPSNYSLHKLIISQRRRDPEKKTKDKEAAISILRALIENEESNTIKDAFTSIPQKWQKKIIKRLEKTTERDVLEIFSSALLDNKVRRS